jgi:hypothetical protein
MRKVLRVAAMAAVGMTLLSCARRPPEVYAPPPPPDYAGPPPVVRTPLPPGAYAPPPPVAYAPPPSAPYGRSTYAGSEPPPQPAGHLVWRASKQWAETKPGPRTSAADSQAKFKAAQAKATEVGVENLTKEDIAGLSATQLKELRGY